MNIRRVLGLLVALALAALSVGCGSFSASPSVSPATFFVPGLIQKQAPHPEPSAVPPAVAVAAALPNS